MKGEFIKMENIHLILTDDEKSVLDMIYLAGAESFFERMDFLQNLPMFSQNNLLDSYIDSRYKVITKLADKLNIEL